MGSKLQVFFAELKRRRVYRVAVIYAGTGVAISLGCAELYDVLLLPDWTPRLVIVLLAIGFPIALVLAWAYEVRPEEPRAVKPSEKKASPTPGPATPGAIAAREERKSIVVLPFDNMSPDPGDAYFSDGLTEEIITHLSHLQSLRVISRNSAMVLKGTEKSTSAIAKELNVQYVLEGSVRKAGNDLRITAQLIDAEEDAHVWAEKYDGVLDDVFGIQEDVARSIVEHLALRLSSREERFLSARPIQEVPAYKSYLSARHRVWEGTPEALEKAVHDLEMAMGLVGENPLILSGLGYVFFQKANLGIEQDEAVEKAERYARKALTLDRDSAEAEIVLGASRQAFFGDQRASIDHCERARRLDPNNADAVLWLTNAYLLIGRMERARALGELLVKLDPLTAVSYLEKAAVHSGGGEIELAVELSKRAYEMAPDSPYCVWFYSFCLAHADRVDEFRKVRERGLPPDSVMTRLALIYEAVAMGDREAVLNLFSEEMERTGRRDPQWSYFLSGALAGVGETDRALEWLENAVDLGFINYPLLTQHDRFLAHLRGRPQFDALMERVKQEWEAFEV